MATRVRGLSPEDVQAIRDGVAAGRRPKVVFTEAAGQIAGQLGQVVSVGDPADGDEFVVVRFGRDELPFSPGDLRVAPKGAVARKAAPPPPRVVAPEPEFVIDKPVVPSSRRRGSSSRALGAAGGAASARAPGAAAGSSGVPGADSGAAAGSSSEPGADASSGAASPPVPAVSSGAVSPASGSSAGASSASAASRPSSSDAGASPSPPAARRKAARPAKPKGPAGLTVTLAYGEGEWTVSASQGAKTLARPYVVKPAEALRMVSLVDVPGVQEAVAQILAAERDEAEREAERLRAELAEVEARLAELREAG
jgi:hypothetical protein